MELNYVSRLPEDGSLLFFATPSTLKKTLNEKIGLTDHEAAGLQELATKRSPDDPTEIIPIRYGKRMLALVKENENRPLHPYREAAGDALDVLEKFKTETIYIDADLLSPAQCGAVMDGLILGGYRFSGFKTSDIKPTFPREISFIGADNAKQTQARKSQILASAANLTRQIADTPANHMTPVHLAAEAQKVADDHDLEIEILDEAAMAAKGLGALLAVSQGSAHEARLITLKYTHPEAEQTLALVGKGLTFDSGGVSLKQARGMMEMKYDKSGGAAVLGAAKAIAELQPAINVVIVIPSSENVTGANAYKPGDVVTACNGKTIEIANTDAEGRLILADALAYTVVNHQPDKMVNIATLTGAVIHSLGRGVAAVAGTSDRLCHDLIQTGNEVDERLWQMPIFDVHEELLETRYADLLNVVDDNEASLVNGSAFLKEFVGKTAWAAIDIGSTAWKYRGSRFIKGPGASGFGTRLLTQWVLHEAGEGKVLTR